MNNDELILKARGHLNCLLRHPLFSIGIEPDKFTKANISEEALVAVRFSCQDREDTVAIVLNSKTGDFFNSVHTPKQPKKQTGG